MLRWPESRYASRRSSRLERSPIVDAKVRLVRLPVLRPARAPARPVGRRRRRPHEAPSPVALVVGALDTRVLVITLRLVEAETCVHSGTCREGQQQGMIENEERLQVRIPPVAPSGSIFQIPLRGLGIHNFYLRLRVFVEAQPG